MMNWQTVIRACARTEDAFAFASLVVMLVCLPLLVVAYLGGGQ